MIDEWLENTIQESEARIWMDFTLASEFWIL